MTKLGLALGGGGARGLAHIGVLKVLERKQIPIYAITGCSMGAIIGGLYAYFQDAIKLEFFLLETINNPDFTKQGIQAFNQIETQRQHGFEDYFNYIKAKVSILNIFHNQSVFSEKATEEFIKFIPDVEINKLPIKFSAIATDLLTGSEINIKDGSLRAALKASSAIPGFFPPVKMNDFLLIDGSASESVPVEEVKELGANRVIAVDVTKCLKETGPLDNGIEIIYRAEEITSFLLSQERLKTADLVIKPEVRKQSWANFEEAEEIIKKGEIAAEKILPEIESLSSKNQGIYKFRKLFR